MSQILDLGPRIRSQVLENVLGSGPMSQVYVLGTRKGPRIRFYVLDLVLDLGPMSQNQYLGPRKYPQIQVLGLRFRFQVLENVLDLGPIGPRFMYQVLGKVLELGATSQKRSYVQFLSSRKFLYIQVQDLDLGPRSQKMSQIQVLRHGPRIRILGPRKCTWIQVLGPRFRFQVLGNVLDLGPYFLGLCTRYWKRYQNQVLRPRIGPRFRS